MSLEAITSGAAHTIADLVPSNPTAGDDVAQGDDHLRNIKLALQLTWPNLSDTCCGVAAELMIAHKGGTVSGALMVKDTLTVSSCAVIGTTLGVGTDMSVGGAISVDGKATFNGEVSISSNVAIGGTLNVTGSAGFGSHFNAAGNLSVGGTGKIGGAVTIGGAVQMASTLSVGGNAIFSEDMTVSGNVVIENTLSVLGTTKVNDTLTVVGVSNLKGGVSVGGNVVASGNVTPGGYVNAGSWMSCTDLSAAGQLVVGGASTFNDDLSVSGAFNVAGISTQGQINATNIDCANTISGSCVEARYARSAGEIASSLVFSSGTRVVFQQTTVPSGWSKETDGAYNNRALRLVTGTVSSGGTTGFTSVFTSSRSTSSDGGHTPTGTVSGAGLLTQSVSSGVGASPAQSNHSHTLSMNAVGNHSHDTNLAVQYRDVVIGERS